MADFAKIPKASVKQSYSRLFPISNDFFLVLCVGGLVACTIWEVRYQISQRKNKRKTSESATPKCLPKYNISLSDMSPAIFSPPIHNGCTSLEKIHLDPLTMAMYMPLNVYISTTTSSSGYSSSRLVNNNTNSSQQQNANNSSNLSTTSAATSSSDVPPQTTRAPSQADSAALEQLATKMSILPGCEPGSPAALELQQKYPSLSTVDIVRFLVARKGVVQQAAEMIDKERAWHNQHFPVRREEVRAAIETRCFFPSGRARDGSPVVYMRGGLYDNTVATPQQYVLAAAHTIEYALKQYPDQVNVTVVVHSSAVPGVKNATGADTNFIKLFIQVLSDNYPERLRKLVIFPFPWYGRAIWGVVKVFVDKRTQDKILLISSSGTGIPAELSEIVDPRDIPECCGGQYKEPLIDLMDTLEDQTKKQLEIAEE